jgi:hypothetical protein
VTTFRLLFTSLATVLLFAGCFGREVGSLRSDPGKIRSRLLQSAPIGTSFDEVEAWVLRTPTGRWIPGINDCNTYAKKAIVNSTPHDVVSFADGPYSPIVYPNSVRYQNGSIHSLDGGPPPAPVAVPSFQMLGP